MDKLVEEKKPVDTVQYKRILVSICHYLATASLGYNLSILYQTHEPYNIHSTCLPNFLRRSLQIKLPRLEKLNDF